MRLGSSWVGPARSATSEHFGTFAQRGRRRFSGTGALRTGVLLDRLFSGGSPQQLTRRSIFPPGSGWSLATSWRGLDDRSRLHLVFATSLSRIFNRLSIGYVTTQALRTGGAIPSRSFRRSNRNR